MFLFYVLSFQNPMCILHWQHGSVLTSYSSSAQEPLCWTAQLQTICSLIICRGVCQEGNQGLHESANSKPPRTCKYSRQGYWPVELLADTWGSVLWLVVVWPPSCPTVLPPGVSTILTLLSSLHVLWKGTRAWETWEENIGRDWNPSGMAGEKACPGAVSNPADTPRGAQRWGRIPP